MILALHSKSGDAADNAAANSNGDDESELEYNLDGITKKDVDDATAFLRRHADRIVLIQNGDSNLDDALNKDVDIAISWSSDATTVMLGSREKEPYIERNLKIRFAVPEEGTIVSRICFVLPADSPNPDEAEKFLDYLLRPDVAGRVTTYCRCATTVIGASTFVDGRILNSPAYFKHPTPGKTSTFGKPTRRSSFTPAIPKSLATDTDYSIAWESVRRAVTPLSRQDAR